MANTVATPPSVGDPAGLSCTTKKKWSRWAWSKSGWMTLKRGLSSRQGGWAITSSHHSGGIKINIHRRYDQLQYKRLWPVSWLTLVVKSLCHWCRHVGASQGHDKVAQRRQQLTSSCFHPIEEERDGGSWHNAMYKALQSGRVGCVQKTVPSDSQRPVWWKQFGNTGCHSILSCEWLACAGRDLSAVFTLSASCPLCWGTAVEEPLPRALTTLD